MVYYDGLLYYTCSGNGKIYAIEVATGKKIWAEPSPNKFSNNMNGNKKRSGANIGAGGIAINSNLGYLYTSDYYFAMCLKLPKR
jgi:outer membrane protein assembly factor BamB